MVNLLLRQPRGPGRDAGVQAGLGANRGGGLEDAEELEPSDDETAPACQQGPAGPLPAGPSQAGGGGGGGRAPQSSASAGVSAGAGCPAAAQAGSHAGRGNHTGGEGGGDGREATELRDAATMTQVEFAGPAAPIAFATW